MIAFRDSGFADETQKRLGFVEVQLVVELAVRNSDRDFFARCSRTGFGNRSELGLVGIKASVDSTSDFTIAATVALFFSAY